MRAFALESSRKKNRQTDRYLVFNALSGMTVISGQNLEKLEKLHWLPISERIKYKVTCMCFSAINGSGPVYLSELLHVYTPSRTLRSSSDTCMLEIQQYKRKTRGFCTFSCFGPHIWNSLPQDLRHCSTLSSFKAKLKTFLFSQYFHPN